MSEYRDLTLDQIAELARRACPELGAIGSRRLIDYETGAIYFFADNDTPMFLASARDLVLELVRRLQETQPHVDHPRPTG